MLSRNLTWVAAGALLVVGVAVAGIHFAGSGTSSAAAAASSAADDLAALALPPIGSVGSPVPSANVAAATTLAAEIAAIRPMISDTNGPLDRGTASLALWASTNLTWSDLKALSGTTPALFRKDPDEERGRSLCIEGTIQEIRAEKNLSRRLVLDRSAPLVEQGNGNGVGTGTNTGNGSGSGSLSATRAGGADSEHADGGEAARLLLADSDDAEWVVPGGKVFFATIVEPDHSKTEEARLKAKPFIIEAIAVKSTGALVDGDSARFCGILTGVVLTGNDLRLEHRAVGMFDLPENTGGPPHVVTPAASNGQ
ncbi:MAG TPA: hypothetical protein VK745_31490 [Polyangiaceae bacterium]|nr:hypothetical protein [Polyangiaceae bacterium]